MDKRVIKMQLIAMKLLLFFIYVKSMWGHVFRQVSEGIKYRFHKCVIETFLLDWQTLPKCFVNTWAVYYLCHSNLQLEAADFLF